jgi:CheY-like chemotaxis protein
MANEDFGNSPASAPADRGADSDLVRSILVVDANPDISDLVRMVLEDTGRYRVLQALSAEDALYMVNQGPPDLVILDFDLPDLSGPELVDRLRQGGPDMEVIVIPLNKKLSGAQLTRDRDGEIIGRPFYLPELPAIVESALGLAGPGQDPGELEAPPDIGAPPPEPELDFISGGSEVERDLETYIAPALRPYEPLPQWLEEPDEAAFYLSDIILESSAIAGLLTRQGELWSATEGLPQSQIQEITSMVSEHRGSPSAGGEWIHLLRPGYGGDNFRLYTAPVMADIALTLVFPSSVPLTEMRGQARKLTAMLSDVDPLSFEV